MNEKIHSKTILDHNKGQVCLDMRRMSMGHGRNPWWHLIHIPWRDILFIQRRAQLTDIWVSSGHFYTLLFYYVHFKKTIFIIISYFPFFSSLPSHIPYKDTNSVFSPLREMLLLTHLFRHLLLRMFSSVLVLQTLFSCDLWNQSYEA